MSAIERFTCDQPDCCRYVVTPYQPSPIVIDPLDEMPKPRLKKAGICVYDEHGYILLVQSRGQLWGPPKGSIQPNEIPLDCAIREVKEETGFVMDEKDFCGSTVIKTKALYYFMKVDRTTLDIHPQTHIKDNDANAIGWFHVNCLNGMIGSGKLSINQHCRLLIKKIFDYDIIFNTDTNSLHKRLLRIE